MALTGLTVTLNSNATTTSGFLSGIQLMDANNNNVVNADGASITSESCNSSNVCLVTWNFGSSGFVLSGTYTFTLSVNDMRLTPMLGSEIETLSANVSSFSYSSASNPSQSTMVSPNASINSVSFLPGTFMKS
jgi:hypothetical protein